MVNDHRVNHKQRQGVARTRWTSEQYDRYNDPLVDIELAAADTGRRPEPLVRVTLTHQTARQIMVALGINSTRYGREVRQFLTGLNIMLIGMVAGPEPSTPHGPGHGCRTCRILKPIHPGSACCNACFWENPEQYIEFPTVCEHRLEALNVD